MTDATGIAATQDLVASICAEVLGLARVGLDDDLYELGGDSQQAVLIALRIESALPVELPLEVMERNANVRAIATWIDVELGRHASRVRMSTNGDP